MILGVDPGATGALALLDDEDGGALVEVYDMPVVDKHVSPALLVSILGHHIYHVDITAAVVEQVSAMPKQGVTGVFTFGRGYGAVLGVLAALRIPVVHTRPNEWKRQMGLAGKAKEASRQRAIDRWPEMAGEFKLKKHDGRAEAALIALWLHERGGR